MTLSSKTSLEMTAISLRPDRGGVDADEAPDRGGFGPDRGGVDAGTPSSAWPKLQKKLEAAAAALEAARRAHRAGLA
jgi:hypothetical protein